jgi:hypothetical protein
MKTLLILALLLIAPFAQSQTPLDPAKVHTWRIDYTNAPKFAFWEQRIPQQLTRSLREWSAVTGVQWEKSTGKEADLVVRWESIDRDILATAPNKREIVLNSRVSWTGSEPRSLGRYAPIAVGQSTWLLPVLLHEVGHIHLGSLHVEADKWTVMAARPPQGANQLFPTDKKFARFVYQR